MKSYTCPCWTCQPEGPHSNCDICDQIWDTPKGWNIKLEYGNTVIDTLFLCPMCNDVLSGIRLRSSEIRKFFNKQRALVKEKTR